MSSLPATFAEDVIDQPARAQFEVFLDEHRGALNGCLDGLTEEQVRRPLVPSRTTLLGLVKHAAFVEKVWFDEAVTGRPRAEIGIPATHASQHAARRHPSGWTKWSTATGAARSRCAGCTSTCCANSLSTAGTQTSCASSSSTSSALGVRSCRWSRGSNLQMPVEPCLGSLECVEQVRALDRHVTLPRVDDELTLRAGERDRAEELLPLPRRCAAVHLA